MLTESHWLRLSLGKEVRALLEGRKERSENWACSICPSSQLFHVTLCSLPNEMKNILAHENRKGKASLQRTVGKPK